MAFRYEGNQKVWIRSNGHAVTVLGRSEFYTGKQNRYYIRSETAIPGKNNNEDWINEDQLTHIEPVAEIVPEPNYNAVTTGKRPGKQPRQLGGKLVREMDSIRQSNES